MLAVLFTAYWLGSIPTAYLVARQVAGLDIRTVGDGNPGARNVWLHLGWRWGVIVAVLDMLKGYAAVRWAQALGFAEPYAFLAGMAAVLGHDTSPFLRFRGGQGMATTLGVLLALMPWETLLAIAVFLLAYRLTHRWDESLFVGMIWLPLLPLLLGRDLRYVLYPVALLPTVGVKKMIDQARRSGGVRRILHLRR
ncbi:glycerol-3-phosphate acyltransferase [Thermoflexus sp.]|uniref:glycerol-3-phosphate acyltransferase n=1 Tax=Thermoflexus sp. TaxID=1969742 RepID=UPI00176DE5A5|nr:glycerol-3-phosphate acyltransferase [Thermoflexus sp.]